ncbi:PucR family transcriptional regulator [Pseudonocardia sp. H11422]|uniref:PucR family transcriptional regulator n=1 Tax=Pseudonocardia sp. H11422 TaxID=2835866 RepID=UPI0027392901|nr:helix-turn-helix domain-containing protein [Pseudonocardia sp. H11422]
MTLAHNLPTTVVTSLRAARPIRRWATLRDLLVSTGDGMLDVISAPAGLDVPVRRAVIWDPTCPAAVDPGDIVLAVGVSGASPDGVELLDHAAGEGAAAVAVKGPLRRSWIDAAREQPAVALLEVPRELGWDQLHATLRTSIAVGQPDIVDELTEAPLGDLGALADAAAAALDGPVEIVDPALRLLAFSSGGPDGEDSDELRLAWILARRPPSAFLEWVRSTGALQRLRDAYEPVRLDPPGGRPRSVVPIRAGVDVLGYVLHSPGRQGCGARHTEVLTGVARAAAAHVVRQRVGRDVDRRLCADLLRGALDGAGSPAVLARRLALRDGEPVRLLGFEVVRSGARAPASATAHREMGQLVDLVALRFGLADGVPGAVVALGSCVYALVPADGEPKAPAADVAAGAARQLGLSLVAAIGAAVSDLQELPAERAEIDRVLVLGRHGNGPVLSTSEELRSALVLAELGELARERPRLLQGRIERLREIDETCKTEYLTTLRAYFDSACDLVEASKRLFVHRNTLRYRLRRIQERCGLDLGDPDERLVAELQLRLTVER